MPTNATDTVTLSPRPEAKYARLGPLWTGKVALIRVFVEHVHSQGVHRRHRHGTQLAAVLVDVVANMISEYAHGGEQLQAVAALVPQVCKGADTVSFRH